MVRLEITNNTLTINEKGIQFPVSIDVLRDVMGNARHSRKKYNHIYTWDHLGVLAYSKDGENVESIALQLTHQKFDFSPESCFDATFTIDGLDYKDFYRKNRRHVKKATKHDVGGSLIVSDFDIYFDMDDDKVIESISIGAYAPPPPKVYSDKYKHRKINGDTIEFTDFNFKLAIVQQLMYEKKLLTPIFDVYEFIENYPDREIDIEKEGYDFIPEVTAYFEALEIDKRYADEITEICQDGGDDIYGQLLRFWDGEDDRFNIRNFDDVKHFPKLRSMNIFYSDNLDDITRELSQKNIYVTSI